MGSTQAGHCPHLAGGAPERAAAKRRSENFVCQGHADCTKGRSDVWVCLAPGCAFRACRPRSKADERSSPDFCHLHFQSTNHSVFLSMGDWRTWCYLCKEEVNPAQLTPRHNPSTTSTIPASTTSSAAFGSSAKSPAVRTPGYILQDDSDDDEAQAAAAGTRPASPPELAGLKGLSNLGNTCYLNAAVQALSNCPAFAHFFLDCHAYISLHTPEHALARKVERVIGCLWDGRDGYLQPMELVTAVRQLNPSFRGYGQQDSQEFLRFFIDKLHEELRHDGIPLPKYTAKASPARLGIINVDEMSSSGDDQDDDPAAGAANGDTASSQSAKSAANGRAKKPKDKSSSTTSQPRNRSVISDLLCGQLKSSIICGHCHEVSDTFEPFYDLLVEIPPGDALPEIRARLASPGKEGDADAETTGNGLAHASQAAPPPSASTSTSASSGGFGSGLLSTLGSWLWPTWLQDMIPSIGPTPTLMDCIAAFCTIEEMSGDNAYNCSKCKGARDARKILRLHQLPEVLCITIKRFKYSTYYPTKISRHVDFPLRNLDLAQFLSEEGKASQRSTQYRLTAVVNHLGSISGGHYTAYVQNYIDQRWYEYDDSLVTVMDESDVVDSTGYMLFYTRDSSAHDSKRAEVFAALQLEQAESAEAQPNGHKKSMVYISRPWAVLYTSCVDPGPMRNSDFACPHDGILPSRFHRDVVVAVPYGVWKQLHATFGGDPPILKLRPCKECIVEEEFITKTLKERLAEHAEVARMEQVAAKAPKPEVFLLSWKWVKAWQTFVRSKNMEAPPPGPMDNSELIDAEGKVTAYSEDYIELSEDVWRFLHGRYGGGPVLKVRNPALVEMDETAAGEAEAAGQANMDCGADGEQGKTESKDAARTGDSSSAGAERGDGEQGTGDAPR